METINLILTLCAFLLGAAVFYGGYRLGKKNPETVEEIIEYREVDPEEKQAEKPHKKKPVTDEEEKEDKPDDKPSIEEQWDNILGYEGPQKGKKA